MSEELYASLGRKTVELEKMHAEYDRLLDVLSKVVSGAITVERVTVNVAMRSWAVKPVPVQPVEA